jgi:competence protein ComFC
MICEKFSFSHICKDCRLQFLSPSIYKRKIVNKIDVISFYKYSDIESLLHTKHTELGFYIYDILAQMAIKKFSNEFHFDEKVAILAVDDHVRHGYSHTAILAKSLKSENLTPYYSKLRAQNRDRYSAKSYQYRFNNPREFILKEFKESSVIIIDDIITTSLTLSEAVRVCEKNEKDVLFCLTLADADLKD